MKQSLNANSITNGNPTARLSRYEISHEAKHLQISCLASELHKLLRIETATNRNAWYETKFAHADLAGYLADLDVARDTAKTQPTCHDEAMALEIRYALLESSARTVVSEFPPSLLKALLVHGLWSVETVWSYYNQIQDDGRRLHVLELLIPYLTDELIQVSFDAWAERSPTTLWGRALSALAPRLTKAQIDKTVDLFLRRLYETDKVDCFSKVAPYLSEHHFELILGHLQDEFWSSGVPGEIVGGMAPSLPVRFLHSAVSIVAEDVWAKETAWLRLAARLDEPQLRYALSRIESTPDYSKYRVIASAFPALLPRMAQLGFLEEALQRMSAANDARFGIFFKLLPVLASQVSFEGLLAHILKILPSDILRAAALELVKTAAVRDSSPSLLNVAQAMKDPRSRAIVLCSASHTLPDSAKRSVLSDAFAAAQKVQSRIGMIDCEKAVRTAGFMRAHTLCTVAQETAAAGESDLAVEAVDSALSIARDEFVGAFDTHDDKERYGEMMAICVGKLTQSLRVDQLKNHIDRIRSMNSDKLQGKAFTLAAPYLTPEMCEYAVQTTKSIEEAIALAPILPENLLKQLLADIYSRLIPDVQPDFIAGLAPHLPPDLLLDCVQMMHRIQDPLGQSVALASLGSFTPADESEQIAIRALETAKRAGPHEDGSRRQALCDVAPFLPANVLRLAIADASKLAFDFLSGPALSTLSRELAIRGYSEEAWSQASLLSNTFRTEALASLISVVPQDTFERVLEELASVDTTDFAGRNLLESALPRLALDAVAQIIEKALAYAADDRRLALLASLATHAAFRLHAKILDCARRSEDNELSAIVIAGIAGVTDAPETRTELLQEAIARLRPDCDQHNFPRAAAAIASSATELATFEQLLAAVEACTDMTAKMEAMARLVTFLPENLFERIGESFLLEGFEDRWRLAGAISREYANRGNEDRGIELYFKLPDWAKGEALNGMAPHLRSDQLLRILNDCEHIDDSHAAQTRILESVIPHLPEELLSKALELVLEVPSKFNRKQSLQLIIGRIAPTTSAHAEFDRILASWASRKRLDVLYDMASVAPLIASLGDATTVGAVIQAVDDVIRWWD